MHRAAALSLAVLSACTCAPAPPPLPTLAPEPPPAPVVEAVPDQQVLLDDGGLVVDRVRWTRDDRSGWAWRARVPRAAADVAVVATADIARLDAFLPDRPGAWAAVDGGFYDDGPMGLVRVDGTDVAPHRKGGGSGIFVVDEAGAVDVIPAGAWPVPARHAVQSIDRLVVDGASVVSATHDATLAARAAVALTADAVWVVILAQDESIARDDDRTWHLDQVYGKGMLLWEFADWLVTDLGATKALNLDGGISTQLLAQGSDGTRIAVNGVYGTVNAVVIGPQPTP